MEKKFVGMVLIGLVAEIAVCSSGVKASDYPESAFGKAPAPLELGVGQSYASRAVQDMETPSEDSDPPVWGQANYARASRSPAGLVVDQPVQPMRNVSSAATEASLLKVTERSMPEARSASQIESGDPQLEKNALVRKNGVQEVALIASDLGFFPKTFFVTRNIPVRLFVTGASKNTLCVMMDSFGVKRQIRMKKIEEISFTPSDPGRYRFYCPVNNMEGTMVVKEITTRLDEQRLSQQPESSEIPESPVTLRMPSSVQAKAAPKNLLEN